MIVSGTDNGVDPGLSGYILADAGGSVVAALNYGATVGETFVVPEPNSIFMALFAGIAMLVLRRKR